MARVIVATCSGEGALYSPDKDPSAPIRFYSDRSVEDEIILSWGMPLKRPGRLSRKTFRLVKKAAALNRAEGRV